MRVTYLVLAHHKPQQLASLLHLLLAEGDRAVVHVDAAADEAPFRRAAADLGPSVAFTGTRHRVRWGGFGMVAATLSALRQAVRSLPADHYVLLSGADLPIKPIAALHRELAAGQVRMNCWPMPDERRGKPMSRLERWYVAPRHRDSRVAARLNRLLERLPRRDVAAALGPARPHAGSQWWTMPHGCAEQVLDFVDRSPRFVRFFHHVRVPDEMFFQTVVKALPTDWDVRPNLTFTRWSSPGRLSPDTLTSADVAALSRTEAFFARKFDLDADPRVLEEVRTRLLAPG
ncbi:beta-1,6-N-acetylglucosaminyltransferase [Kineococcus sp. SYSU DK006]|uniref:beta-1,6-N-acetylglucosaminyltransferase n=1 Tax=Kineococcus sp. SYSU DK006 TaxID=3383127 RepID=UPI003D7D3402